VYRDVAIPENKRVVDVWDFWRNKTARQQQALAAGRA
jgi:hypothetical protein